MKISAIATPALALLALGLVASAKPAAADIYNIQYFQVSTGTTDFFAGNAPSLGTSFNYVLPTLGPDGLPVFNPGFSGSGVFAPTASTYLNAANEILWWSPSNPKGGHVTADGTGTINLSGSETSMFPPPATNDSSHEETAIITGQFTVPAHGSDTVTFTLGADDDGFAYVFPVGDPTSPNSLVESLGGIHGDTNTLANSVTYGPGTYTIEIFYADQDQTDAELSFTNNSDLVITPGVTPEPSSLILLGTGLLGAAGAARRRFAR